MSGFDSVSNYKPEENADFGAIKKGLFNAELTGLKPDSFRTKQGKEVLVYAAEWTVTEVLDGDNIPGWIFKKSYDRSEEEAMKKMLNDFFTLGVDLSGKSDADAQAMFGSLIGTKARIRASGFTPDKDFKTGAEIPVDKRKELQTLRFLKPKAATISQKKASVVPF